MAARKLTELEVQLRQSNTVDVPARQAALRAVDDMMRAATRSGQLLAAAREVTMQAAASGNTAAQMNAMALAQQAYEQRTTAEVAKFRAAYALMAEQNGEAGVGAAEAARSARTAQQQRPFISASKYHGKVRDLMLQASAAAAKALRAIPPLPAHVGPQPRVGPESNVARGASAELLAQPTYGWRPKKYSELMGDFFPLNFQLAAGALSGANGFSLGGQLGTADATANMPTGETFWTQLQKAFGYGVRAAGEAASSEGQKVAGSDPAGGSALQVGGNILNALSAMLGVGVQDGMRRPAAVNGESASTPWGTYALVGGAAIIGVWAISKIVR